jgi:hypothetical protein
MLVKLTPVNLRVRKCIEDCCNCISLQHTFIIKLFYLFSCQKHDEFVLALFLSMFSQTFVQQPC